MLKAESGWPYIAGLCVCILFCGTDCTAIAHKFLCNGFVSLANRCCRWCRNFTEQEFAFPIGLGVVFPHLVPGSVSWHHCFPIGEMLAGNIIDRVDEGTCWIVVFSPPIIFFM